MLFKNCWICFLCLLRTRLFSAQGNSKLHIKYIIQITEQVTTTNKMFRADGDKNWLMVWQTIKVVFFGQKFLGQKTVLSLYK